MLQPIFPALMNRFVNQERLEQIRLLHKQSVGVFDWKNYPFLFFDYENVEGLRSLFALFVHEMLHLLDWLILCRGDGVRYNTKDYRSRERVPSLAQAIILFLVYPHLWLQGWQKWYASALSMQENNIRAVLAAYSSLGAKRNGE